MHLTKSGRAGQQAIKGLDMRDYLLLDSLDVEKVRKGLRLLFNGLGNWYEYKFKIEAPVLGLLGKCPAAIVLHQVCLCECLVW